MVSDDQIREQLEHVLEGTNFDFLGERYAGKVRDSYTRGDTRFLITSDRISCFDVVVTLVPFKGQALNQMAVNWFGQTEDIVSNHLIDVPDPNVMVAKNLDMLPIEVIVREYITGSAWRDYQAGKSISGVELPKGLRASEKLPETIITPSTKAEQGEHDLPISEAEILGRGLVEKQLWEEIKEVSMALFRRGQEVAARHGLIFVDTKYEFGLVNGKLTLADEIHTMDSSRFWINSSYLERFERGEAPEMLDKEPTRQWLISKGYQGEGEIPEFTDQHRIDLSRHYISAFERITGGEFSAEVGPALERVERNLRAYAG